jgi:hypothetical protein
MWLCLFILELLTITARCVADAFAQIRFGGMLCIYVGYFKGESNPAISSLRDRGAFVACSALMTWQRRFFSEKA